MSSFSGFAFALVQFLYQKFVLRKKSQRAKWGEELSSMRTTESYRWHVELKLPSRFKADSEVVVEIDTVSAKYYIRQP